jgi:ribosomal protein S27AE
MRQTLNNIEVTMATASAERTRVDRLLNRAMSSAVSHESMCPRCGGIMVSDISFDLLNSFGESELAATRCVQCGEVVDAVIQRNRRLSIWNQLQ